MLIILCPNKTFQEVLRTVLKRLHLCQIYVRVYHNHLHNPCLITKFVFNQLFSKYGCNQFPLKSKGLIRGLMGTLFYMRASFWVMNLNQ